MSEETKDQEQAVETAVAPETPEEHTPEHRQEPIRIELDDLTEEGRKKIEEALHRPVSDIPVTLKAQEKLPGSQLRLEFEAARAEYDAEQGRLLKDLQKDAVLPGYRKGKVPAKLLQIRLGEDAVRDTFRSLATNAMRQENIKQGLKLTVRPQVTEYTRPEEAGAPVSFKIEAEVEPTVEAKEYKGLSVQVETHPVTDEQVGERLEGMRRENAVMETAPEGAEVAAEDVVIVDAEVFGAQGQKMENLSRENWSLYNYREQLPAPVAELLTGKKVGEMAEAKAENKSTNRRGEEVVYEDTWKVTVREIKRNRLPELDDEFAKDLGDYATLEDLKKKVRADLEQKETESERNASLAELYHKLVELNPIDAPDSLLTAQTYQLIRQDQDQLARYGMRLEHVVHDADQYLTSQRASAVEMVKVQMLLDAIAKNENIAVSEEDVEAEIAKLAERQGRKPLAVRARLEAARQLDAFRDQVQRQKINDFLLANNTVEKVEAKPVEEIAAEEKSAEAEPPAADEAKGEETPQV